MVKMNCSVYIHIPFCRSRCTYCDFNTFAGKDNLISPYVNALCNEVIHVSTSIRDIPTIHTVYFGGGTPSLLSPQHLKLVLSTLRSYYSLERDCEITIEANPGTLDLLKLEGYRELGINRISMGVQSLLSDELKLLGRIHSKGEVYQSILNAKEMDFENIGTDLIFGIPGQTVGSLRETVEQLISLGVNHLSAYSLSIEPGTPLAGMINSGMITPCDDDVIADMYETLMDWLEGAGYNQYEISNWSSVALGKDYRCRHNLQYWYYEPWLGFGAGASSYFNQYRFTNLLGIEEYIAKCEIGFYEKEPFIAASQIEHVNFDQEMDETMMMGLRLTQEGVRRQRFIDRFGHDYLDIYSKEIDQLVNSGLLEFVGEQNGILRLTRKGRMLGNQVFMRFLRD